jgi:hypothetical protein
METNSNKKTSKNMKSCGCLFCRSKCSKCGSIDITVNYENSILRYRYRNQTLNHIWIDQVRKSIFRSKYETGIKLKCNKCGNTIVATGEWDNDAKKALFKSYSSESQKICLGKDSKYHKQVTELFKYIENFMWLKGKKLWNSCSNVHFFFDENAKTKKEMHLLKIERYMFGKYAANDYNRKKVPPDDQNNLVMQRYKKLFAHALPQNHK